MLPGLIVTRPLAQALPWQDALRARGVDARTLPLIDIESVADTTALSLTWQQIDAFAAFMFVSANAVAHFFAARPAGAVWPDGVIAACTGPGTACALRVAGVPPAALLFPAAGQAQESESLWTILQARDWRGRRVRVVRGEVGRDWLAQQWRGAGAVVDFLVVYRRRRPRLDAAGRLLLADVAARPARWVWHFSSAEAVEHLRALAPATTWAQGAALATHARIAQAALGAGFGCVREIEPGLEAVLDALQAQGSRGGATYNPGSVLDPEHPSERPPEHPVGG